MRAPIGILGARYMQQQGRRGSWVLTVGYRCCVPGRDLCVCARRLVHALPTNLPLREHARLQKTAAPRGRAQATLRWAGGEQQVRGVLQAAGRLVASA